VKRDQQGDEPRVPAVDPSLAPGGDADGSFPDTAAGTRLVLYQTEDGAVDLRWRIDPADIAYARAAFGGAEAHAVLRLHRIGAGGEDRVMANADLGSDADATGGLAHYAGSDADGLLQAEIGLASEGGGWLLIARSNGLPAAAQVGARFLYEHPDTPPPARPGGDTGAAPAADAAAPDTADPAEPLRLQPEFPLVEPTLSDRAEADLMPEGTDDILSEAGVGGTSPTGGSTAVRLRAPSALVGAGIGRDTSLGAANDAAWPPGAAAAQRPAAEPPPGGVVPRLTHRPHVQAQTSGSSTTPVAGSGPVCPAAGEATLSAELVVHGSAPPNTLLDLGGHAYRVGPGGRFLLRIPIREREVIMRVLATLPRLPVAARAGDGADPPAPD
jgi:hypothetical protein